MGPQPDEGSRTAGAGGRVSDAPRRASSCARSRTRCRSGSSRSPPERCSSAALQLGWLAPRQGEDVGADPARVRLPAAAVACVFGFLGRDVVAGTGMGLLAGHLALDRARHAHRPAPGRHQRRARPLPAARRDRDARPVRRRRARQARRRRRARHHRAAVRAHRALPAHRGRRTRRRAGIVGLLLLRARALRRPRPGARGRGPPRAPDRSPRGSADADAGIDRSSTRTCGSGMRRAPAASGRT